MTAIVRISSHVEDRVSRLLGYSLSSLQSLIMNHPYTVKYTGSKKQVKFIVGKLDKVYTIDGSTGDTLIIVYDGITHNIPTCFLCFFDQIKYRRLRGEIYINL